MLFSTPVFDFVFHCVFCNHVFHRLYQVLIQLYKCCENEDMLEIYVFLKNTAKEMCMLCNECAIISICSPVF